MKFLVPIVAGFAVAGCAWFHPPAAPEVEAVAPAAYYQHVGVAGEVASPAERAACKAAGGEISREGLRGWEHCVQTYPDAGKTCSDHDDCLGTCRYDGPSAPPGSKVTGACQVRDVAFGCYTLVEKGKLGYAICAD
ncbi:hypothetical protein [Hyphomonas sp.]|jgi:hypothetical protein|uniref:hypothetical protein n=1 Tax=Hyphomonas sp. TaxID=87 RepID=UPI0025C31556|nr:hypothetical protein [Hyphomonas sp.]